MDRREDREPTDQTTGRRESVERLRVRIEGLERELSRERELLHEASLQVRAQVAELKAQAAALARTRRELERLSSRRSVRLTLALTARARRWLSTSRSVIHAPARAARSARRRLKRALEDRRRRPPAAAERTLVTRLGTTIPAAAMTEGPLVSVVVIHRGDTHRLERCLRAISRTAYRDAEVFVVDIGPTSVSLEGTVGLASPLRSRIVSADGRSPSAAVEDAVAQASGELICFLHGDAEPLTEHWLGYLVETARSPEVVAAGARLINPRRPSRPRAGESFAGLTLQHRGITFDRAAGVPRPRVMGGGEDPLTPTASAVGERPALSGACLLLSREAYDDAGGHWDDGEQGIEGVDLSLRLRARGSRLMYDGRAALWHDETACRPERDADAFTGAWGPRIFRESLLDALEGHGRFSDRPFHVAIATASPHPRLGQDDRDAADELGGALTSLGWQVSGVDVAGADAYLVDPSTEAVIVLSDVYDVRRLPSHMLTIAWITGSPDGWLDRPWFDEYDLVFGSRPPIIDLVRTRSSKVVTLVPDGDRAQADALRDRLIAWASGVRYGIRISVPDWNVAERWGDYHFARALQRALERDGLPTRIHFLPDWPDPATSRADVMVDILGLHVAPTLSAQVNILWHISHPGRASTELYDRYDHVFVASDRFTARMAERASTPVASLHQATDPERFHPDPTGPRHELLFVANSRGVRRRIVDDLAGTSHDLAVYGQKWYPELIEPRFVRGDGIPNAELARYYSSASIVLNDHWDDMQAEGFISNRIYDALACGAMVVSDHVEGIDEEFDGAVVTYQARADLLIILDRYLADPVARQDRGALGRAAVLGRHTFGDRAVQIEAAATGFLGHRLPRILVADAGQPRVMQRP